MRGWLRRIRGALGMGLTLAIPAALAGFFMEAFVDPHGRIADIWPALLAYPAFVGGVVFSAALGIVASRRRFDELSIPQFASIGALGGLVLGALAAGVASASISSPWVAALFVAVPTLGCAVAAAGTLAIARVADDRDLVDAGAEVAEVGPSGAEARELLGEGG